MGCVNIYVANFKKIESRTLYLPFRWVRKLMCVKIRENSRICLGEHFIIFFFSGNTRGTARGLVWRARTWKRMPRNKFACVIWIVFGLEAPWQSKFYELRLSLRIHSGCRPSFCSPSSPPACFRPWADQPLDDTYLSENAKTCEIHKKIHPILLSFSC